jgi:DNA-binding Lrp family transcriptional regulator
VTAPRVDPALCRRLADDARATQAEGGLAAVGQHVGNALDIASQLTAAVALHDQHIIASEVRRRLTEQLAAAMGAPPGAHTHEDLLKDVTLHADRESLVSRLSAALGEIAREVGLSSSVVSERRVAAVVEGVRATLAELRDEIVLRDRAVNYSVAKLRSRIDHLERDTKLAARSAKKARPTRPPTAPDPPDAKLEEIVLSTDGAVDLSRSVDELDLSVRAANCLTSAGVRTLGELVQWTALEIRRIRWSSQRVAREISEELAKLGLALAPTKTP